MHSVNFSQSIVQRAQIPECLLILWQLCGFSGLYLELQINGKTAMLLLPSSVDWPRQNCALPGTHISLIPVTASSNADATCGIPVCHVRFLLAHNVYSRSRSLPPIHLALLPVLIPIFSPPTPLQKGRRGSTLRNLRVVMCILRCCDTPV